MDLTRRAVQLCADGTQAELERRLDDARRCYAEAWQAATDDYDRAVAAHYIGHLECDPQQRLVWERRALDHAERAERDLVAPLLGSLYVSLGYAYELVGERHEAERYYTLAAEHGVVHATGTVDPRAESQRPV